MESLEMVRLGRAAQKPFFRLGCKSMILGGRKPRVLFAQNQMFSGQFPIRHELQADCLALVLRLVAVGPDGGDDGCWYPAWPSISQESLIQR